ncbi:uncharacterized protein LOC124818173 [Hydra vulgaris]|uniref:uncharacterized protein LOC124818173 n=1 Tax=Hydra vulgaris TaxID=6087 RepID=UPI001F5E80F7|nr:uncharacterized protein LOC124818173 [Hydra vulgaris]
MEPEQERLIEEFSKESFMQKVQKYPVLYDKFNAEFKNNIMKKNAWAAIGVLFGLTDQECESKYKNIRSAYGRFLRKKKEDTTINVENKATTTELTTESPLSCIDSNDSMNYDEDVSNKVELENENLSENTSNSNTFSNQRKALSEIKSPINIRKKTLKRSLPDENSKIQDAIISTMNNINATLAVSTHEENDDLIHICKSICATIKRLPPKTQAVAKINIQQYLAALEFPDIVD